jgi:acetyl esterase
MPEDTPAPAAPALDPQLREALARHAAITAELGPPAPGMDGLRRHYLQSRTWWNEGGPALARVFDATVPGAHGNAVPVMVYVPEGGTAALRPAYVYLHGGGFRIGGPRANDRQLRELAQAWGGIVVSADYVHVPEQVFPMAVEDTAAVYQWLAAHGAAWGIDGRRLAFGGSSAGANVALGAAQQLGGAECGFLRAGAFVVGLFDGDLDTGSMRRYADAGVAPNRADAGRTVEAYVPDTALRGDPRFDALRGAAATLPPLFLAAAEHDVYCDSSMRLAAHAATAQPDVTCTVYPGMTHLFFGYSRMVERAGECIADMARFLGRQLPPAP